MNWVDIAVGLLMALFLVAGARKGFIREVAGLVAIILAFILSIGAAPIWSEILVERVNLSSSVATIVAFILIFILVFILVRALGSILFKVVRATPLDIIDRLGGSLIGLLKGLLVISLILVFLGLFSLPRFVVRALNESIMAPHVKTVAPAVYDLLKGAVPQMRSLGDVVGESVEKGFSYGKKEIQEKGSQLIDKLQESKSQQKKDGPSETSPEPKKE